MQHREPPPFDRPPAPPGGPPPRAAQQPPAGRRRRRAPQSAQRPRQRRGTSWMTRIFIGLAVLLLLIGGGIAVALMVLSPTDIVRDQLIARVKQQTGRDLTLAGGAGIAVWPKLGVALKGVSLSAPPGMQAPDRKSVV